MKWGIGRGSGRDNIRSRAPLAPESESDQRRARSISFAPMKVTAAPPPRNAPTTVRACIQVSACRADYRDQSSGSPNIAMERQSPHARGPECVLWLRLGGGDLN